MWPAPATKVVSDGPAPQSAVRTRPRPLRTGLDVESAATEIRVFAQADNALTEEVVRIDAAHEAFLRLTPLLSDASRRLHGWTDQQVQVSIHRLRDAAETAKATARGDTAPANRSAKASIELADTLWRVENLHARIAELAAVLGGRSAT